MVRQQLANHALGWVGKRVRTSLRRAYGSIPIELGTLNQTVVGCWQMQQSIRPVAGRPVTSSVSTSGCRFVTVMRWIFHNVCLFKHGVHYWLRTHDLARWEISIQGVFTGRLRCNTVIWRVWFNLELAKKTSLMCSVHRATWVGAFIRATSQRTFH